MLSGGVQNNNKAVAQDMPALLLPLREGAPSVLSLSFTCCSIAQQPVEVSLKRPSKHLISHYRVCLIHKASF